MAHCSVLEHFQKPTDRPSKRIKRSGGHSLVNRGLAVWVRKNVLLIMVDSRITPAGMGGECRLNAVSEAVTRHYIPEKLPANIDYRLGLVVQAPILANQIRFRPIAEQGL